MAVIIIVIVAELVSIDLGFDFIASLRKNHPTPQLAFFILEWYSKEFSYTLIKS